MLDVKCPKCYGSGVVFGWTCDVCHGSGKVTEIKRKDWLFEISMKYVK